MRIPILKGRTFTRDEDAEGKPVVLIDENLARRFWPNEEAVGKHIKYDSPDLARSHRRSQRGQALRFGSQTADQNLHADGPGRGAKSDAVRAQHQQRSAKPGRRYHARDSRPGQGSCRSRKSTTLEEILAREVSPKRFNAGLLSIFAALALLLAAIGVYGVTSYTVAQRTHEVGIRMAIGAQKSDVLKLFMGEGLKLVLAGIAIGLAGAFALTRLLASLLFGVSATDATTFVLVAIALLVVALLACYIPARRATKVDPLVALRYE